MRFAAWFEARHAAPELRRRSAGPDADDLPPDPEAGRGPSPPFGPLARTPPRGRRALRRAPPVEEGAQQARTAGHGGRGIAHQGFTFYIVERSGDGKGSGRDQRGRRRRATHPRPSPRFSRTSDPPCASAIWRLSTRPMPEPCGLVVKNGTNRFAVGGRPGPSSSTQISTAALRRVPAHAHAAARLQRRVGRVAHEVDERLLDLVRVGLQLDVGAALQLRPAPASPAAPRAARVAPAPPARAPAGAGGPAARSPP